MDIEQDLVTQKKQNGSFNALTWKCRSHWVDSRGVNVSGSYVIRPINRKRRLRRCVSLALHEL
jgi:hypothetical protein